MEHKIKTSLNNQCAWPKFGSTCSIGPRKLFPFFLIRLIIHLVTVFAKFVSIEQQVVWMVTVFRQPKAKTGCSIRHRN